jgi:hypothetical protein
MNNPSVIHKLFGTNRGTYWIIAGSVVVIVLGGYLVYNSRDGNPTTAAAAEHTLARTAPAPLTLEK